MALPRRRLPSPRPPLPQRSISWGDSFWYACEGLQYALTNERNFRIHSIVMVLVVLVGVWVHLAPMEWVAILFCIALMFSMELMNTAVESVVNLVCQDEWHPYGKAAKDVAAAACLVAASISFLIGVILFVPKLLDIFFWL